MPRVKPHPLWGPTTPAEPQHRYLSHLICLTVCLWSYSFRSKPQKKCLKIQETLCCLVIRIINNLWLLIKEPDVFKDTSIFLQTTPELNLWVYALVRLKHKKHLVRKTPWFALNDLFLSVRSQIENGPWRLIKNIHCYMDTGCQQWH